MKLLIIMKLNLMILVSIFFLLTNKINSIKLKKSFYNSIECGFNQMNNKHMPLFNNFFIILIIFLIFDLEFFIILPLIILMKKFNWVKFTIIMILILTFIFLSMMYEIKINCINWIK